MTRKMMAIRMAEPKEERRPMMTPLRGFAACGGMVARWSDYRLSRLGGDDGWRHRHVWIIRGLGASSLKRRK
jgi:hypothetical protein